MTLCLLHAITGPTMIRTPRQ